MNIGEKQFFTSFPFLYKIDINENNWMQYVDGWSIFKDIRNDAKRMGINF